MAPPSGSPGIGAMWYKTILQTSVCPFPDANQYTAKPRGFEAGQDQLNWAIVLPATTSGWQVRAISNGVVSASVQLSPGLNYGSFPASAGQQRLEVLASDGSVQMAAAGGRCISSECPDCIYNMNPQVVPLLEDTSARVGKCPAQACADPSILPDDGSGDLGPDVIVDAGLWVNGGNPTVECIPPCVLVLPPFQLGAPELINWPNFTTSILSLGADGSTYTVPTVISVPAFQQTEMPFWPVAVHTGDPTVATFTPVQSIKPPTQVLVLGPNEATMTPTPYPGFSAPTNSTSSPIVWVTGTQRVIIQPQPTFSITSPPPTVPVVTYTRGTAPTSTAASTTSTDLAALHTGVHDCSDFGCPPSGCGHYACDGGCGWFWCGGDCGLLGCGGWGLGGLGPIPVPPPGTTPDLDPTDPDPTDPEVPCDLSDEIGKSSYEVKWRQQATPQPD
jgi:hypothetical protein